MAERYTAENLTFTRSGRTLTDNVSLSLSQGELVTLIGPNGAGKSTLLRLLTGYLKPDSGGCSLAGTALDEWHPQTLSRYRVQLARALAQLWRDGTPRGWLFLDEPTSALDLYHQQHLLRLLKSLTRQGHLHACVVLHDLNLAALWSDRILLLHNGRIVSQGIPETVLQADALARWYGAQVHVGRHPAHAAPQVFLAP